MTKRDEVGRSLGRHDACDPGHPKDVTLGGSRVAHQREGFRTHPYPATGHRSPRRDRLVANVYHSRRPTLVDVGKRFAPAVCHLQYSFLTASPMRDTPAHSKWPPRASNWHIDRERTLSLRQCGRLESFGLSHSLEEDTRRALLAPWHHHGPQGCRHASSPPSAVQRIRTEAPRIRHPANRRAIARRSLHGARAWLHAVPQGTAGNLTHPASLAARNTERYRRRGGAECTRSRRPVPPRERVYGDGGRRGATGSVYVECTRTHAIPSSTHRDRRLFAARPAPVAPWPRGRHDRS